MTDRIEADYDLLEEISAKFKQQSELFGQMLQTLQSRKEALDGMWIGKGHDAFTQEMDSLTLPVCNRLLQALDEASLVTQQVATTLQDAEEDAANQFQVLA